MTLDAYVASLGPLPPLLTVVGLGDGALLDAFDRSGWKGRMVAFEPDTTLRTQLRAGASCRAWLGSDRLRIVDGPDYRSGVEACLAFSGPELRALAEPSFAHRFPEDTRLALQAMARAVRSVRANAESKRRHAEIYARNTLRNAPTLATEGNITALAGFAKDLPVVVVAAGPSLDAQLAALKQAQDRAVIICVDTALRPLTAAGIRPQFVVAVDPTSLNASHLVEVSGSEATWLVAEASVDPHAIGAFTGRVFACRVGDHDPWPSLQAQGFNVGTIRAWGSVLTSAIDLALQMGTTTVAIAGADLAFTDRRPYCRGTTFEQNWTRIADWGTPLTDQWAASIAGWPLVEELDVTGVPQRTAPHLVAFRDWIVEQASTFPKVRFINVSNAGILRGDRIEVGSLEALANSWPTVDIRERIAALRPAGVSARPVEVIEAPIEAPPLTTWRQADPVTMPLVRMRMPRARIHPHADGYFTFAIRTRAGRRWMAQRYVGEPRLYEDRQQLQAVDTIELLRAAPAGTYAMTLDEIAFKPLSEEDPRHDGAPMLLELPADIANYEALPIDLVLQRGL